MFRCIAERRCSESLLGHIFIVLDYSVCCDVIMKFLEIHDFPFLVII